LNNILETMYRMRILSDTLVRRYFDENKLRKALEIGLVEVNYTHNGENIYSLTQVGVKYVFKTLQLANVKKLSAQKLRIGPALCSHQLGLNDFVIGLRLGTDIPFSYWDLKHIPVFTKNVMPDGIIETEDRLYFLEMDVGRETLDRVREKWSHYRNFILNLPECYSRKKIECVFILGNSETSSKRACSISSTVLYWIFDLIGPNFDIFIGSPKDCQNHIMKKDGEEFSRCLKLISDRYGYTISPSPILHHAGYYIRKKGQTERIEVSEAMVHNLISGSFGVFKYTLVPHFLRNEIRQTFGRNIDIVFVVPSDSYIAKLLKTCKVFDTDVIFTTPKRLSSSHNKSFYKALFMIEYSKEEQCFIMYGFMDDSMKEKVYIKKIMITKII